ncbi:E3 ubiquitin-protein ligase FANCL isoform X2 [Nasonia vitripennis]|nr:E3 ubiquitin-protein ligase FANCL isoform X2 [Nasonia vitripennis]
MGDFDEMFQLFPEMVLLSKSPPTWKGVITVRNSNNCKIKVKVKLTVPSFPRLDDAIVHFGSSIASLFGNSFTKQINSILKRSESVPALFVDLIKLIETLLSENQEQKMVIDPVETNARDKLLKELDNVLSENADVTFSSTKDLSAIKLTMNDISIVVQPILNNSGQHSWKIINTDLPDLPGYTGNERKPFSLKEIRNIFQRQVDTMEDVWDQLRRIDNFCWVIDPIQPKPYHLYRRVYLSPLLSFLITLNPTDPTGYPKIKFLGAKNEVEKYRDMIQDEDAIENWDLEYSVYENLLTLLNIDEFPQAPIVDEPMEQEGIVGDEECCICFSMDDESGNLPDEICNNQKCKRRFHSACLFQWLQELATNKIVFNKIFGPCPNCGDEVSCNVSSS